MYVQLGKRIHASCDKGPHSPGLRHVGCHVTRGLTHRVSVHEPVQYLEDPLGRAARVKVGDLVVVS